jgi:hypothetical protein
MVGHAPMVVFRALWHQLGTKRRQRPRIRPRSAKPATPVSNSAATSSPSSD